MTDEKRTVGLSARSRCRLSDLHNVVAATPPRLLDALAQKESLEKLKNQGTRVFGNLRRELRNTPFPPESPPTPRSFASLTPGLKNQFP